MLMMAIAVPFFFHCQICINLRTMKIIKLSKTTNIVALHLVVVLTYAFTTTQTRAKRVARLSVAAIGMMFIIPQARPLHLWSFQGTPLSIFKQSNGKFTRQYLKNELSLLIESLINRLMLLSCFINDII